jgi:hypothetical protein
MTQLPLDQIANEINVRLKLADKAEDHRIAAGYLLLEAQERIQSAQELDEHGQPWLWGQWCARFITGRTDRDIRRCIALVKPADKSPEERRAAELREQRSRMQELRERERTHVRPVSHHDPVEPTLPSPASLEALIAAVKDLATPDFERFKAWFRGYCGA